MAVTEERQIQSEMARNEPACEALMETMQLISNKHRFRIICLLSRGDYSVSNIAEILQIEKMSNLSQQLKILRLAGIISSRREEKRIVYSLSNERIGRMIQILRDDFMLNGESKPNAGRKRTSSPVKS
jgi:DNA-binding transcriptional ArsR family regulator